MGTHTFYAIIPWHVIYMYYEDTVLELYTSGHVGTSVKNVNSRIIITYFVFLVFVKNCIFIVNRSSCHH